MIRVLKSQKVENSDFLTFWLFGFRALAFDFLTEVYILFFDFLSFRLFDLFRCSLFDFLTFFIHRSGFHVNSESRS